MSRVRMMMEKDPFFWFTLACGTFIVAFILLPLIELVTSPSISDLWESIKDKNVAGSICLSVYTAGSAAIISFLFGTPLAYFLARHDFKGKRFLEAAISHGFTYEVNVKREYLTFKALVTKKSLVELGLREGIEVFISFEPASVHTF